MSPEIEELIEQYTPMAQAIAVQVWRGAPHQLELAELTSLAYYGLAEAGSMWEDYCLVPSTPVLTADLRWRPVGDLEVGQELVAFDEHGPRRHYRRSAVLDTSRRLAECVLLTFTDGRQVTCSLPHQWLTTTPARSNKAWRRAGDLRPGMRLVTPLRWWPEESSFESGWLSGLYDGEGWLVRDGARGVRGVGVAQRAGAVFDRVKSQLAVMGLEAHARNNGSVETVLISQRRDVIELLARLRPSRLYTPQAWEDKAMQSSPESDSIVESVERVGVAEVVTLETSTKTYLADGMATHNCERNNYDPQRLEYFRPYAQRRARGKIMDTLRKNDHVQRSVRTKAQQLTAAGAGTGATEEQLAQRTGMSLTEIRSVLSATSKIPVSLEAMEDAGETSALVSQSVSLQQELFDREIRRVLITAVRRMSKPHQVVLALHYVRELEIREVAVLMKITESRASRLHTEAVLDIHAALAPLTNDRS